MACRGLGHASQGSPTDRIVTADSIKFVRQCAVAPPTEAPTTTPADATTEDLTTVITTTDDATDQPTTEEIATTEFVAFAPELKEAS